MHEITRVTVSPLVALQEVMKLVRELRVPQTTADAALQILKWAPVIEMAEQAIIDAKNSTESKVKDSSVVQPWVSCLSMMQQSVVLCALRGPDGIRKYHPNKYLIRWFRRCVLVSSMDKKVYTDPGNVGGGSFTGPSFSSQGVENLSAYNEICSMPSYWIPKMEVVVSEYIKTLDEMPAHFKEHFMHGIEILGYKHPDAIIRDWWRKVYFDLVAELHLRPETEEELDERLGDDINKWLARSNPATTN